MAAGFGEDVHPGVAVGGVRRGRGMNVLAVGRVGEWFGGGVEVFLGEELEGLGHSRLVGAAVGGVPVAVGWEGLS